MSKIVLTLAARGDALALAKHVRPLVGLGIADLLRRLTGVEPICEVALFGSDHDEALSRLRQLMDIAERHKASLDAYDLEPDESWSNCAKDLCRIGPIGLRNKLEAIDEERARQDRLDDLRYS